MTNYYVWNKNSEEYDEVVMKPRKLFVKLSRIKSRRKFIQELRKYRIYVRKS